MNEFLQAAAEPMPVPDWARGVSTLVVFSGAGISTDSGIPDFRGPSGEWTKDPTGPLRHTYQAFMASPELRASYWKSRHEHEVWAAEPNVGHRALVSLLEAGIDTMIVTQNTDGLHQRGGMPAERVIELHGTMRFVVCVGCGERTPTEDTLARVAAGETVPVCLRCGGILKTASTMFGQTMDPLVFSRAELAVTSCDLVLAVGTTLTVEPAGSLCATAVRAGARLVIVNLGQTPYDGIATEVLREPLAEALPRIVQQIVVGCDDTVPGAPASADDGGDGGAADEPRVPRPSLLLGATQRTARFHDRVGVVRRLAAWCAGMGVRVHLIWGPAGIGKSRLAVEFAHRVSGEHDVVFLTSDAELPEGGRQLVVVVDDADVRKDQVARVLRATAERSSVRVLLFARTPDRWWEAMRPEGGTNEKLASLYSLRSGHTDAVREAIVDYAAGLTSLGFPCEVPDREFQFEFTDATQTPGDLQASVLARLLSPVGHAPDVLLRCESAHLRRSAVEHGLRLPADALTSAAATAILCGAAEESEALSVLKHVPPLHDADLRRRTARWLRECYPPLGREYWSQSLPDPVTEQLIIDAISPQFLLGMLMETTGLQDRRVLTVLARAATTRPAVHELVVELLSLLPGLSPAAVDVAVHSGNAVVLADALISLAKSVALPAELLDSVPAGTTELGEFPVLLAESLVEAYEYRLQTHPASARRGLTSMLIEQTERLADLGRAEEALACAQRAVQSAEVVPDDPGFALRAAAAERRAADVARRSAAPPAPGSSEAD